MEFPFSVVRALRPNSDGIAVIRPTQTFPYLKDLSEIINRMGHLSAVAQGLPTTITTAQKFFPASDNVLYVKAVGERVVGFVKTGVRRLFHFSEAGVKELQPLCLLDFYVHESMQRSGYGKELYEFMLKDAQTLPHKIAIDRPSLKLQNFMRKHYNLHQYIPQSNNYVIYSQFFDGYGQSKPPRQMMKEESRIRGVGMMVLAGNGEPRPATVVKETVHKELSEVSALPPKRDLLPLMPRDKSARGIFRPPWGITDDIPSYSRGERTALRPKII